MFFECSWQAFFSSSAAVSFLVLFLHFLLKRDQALARFGVECLDLCVFLVLARGYMPFQFFRIPEGLASDLAVWGIHLTRGYSSLQYLSLWLSRGKHLGVAPRIFLLAWAAGSAAFLAKRTFDFIVCKKKLLEMPRVENGETLDIFQKAFREIFPEKENRCVLVNSDLFGSAAVFGMGRPVVVLPDAAYSPKELYYVFRHELLHVKHRDCLRKILCALLAAAHWWNPIISWLFPRLMVQVQELRVDHRIADGLAPKEKLCYLTCIEKTARHALACRQGRASVHRLGQSGRKRDALQRFRFIMRPETASYAWKGVLALFLIFIFSFTFYIVF